MTECQYISEAGPGYRASATTCRGPTEALWIPKISAQGPVERNIPGKKNSGIFPIKTPFRYSAMVPTKPLDDTGKVTEGNVQLL